MDLNQEDVAQLLYREGIPRSTVDCLRGELVPRKQTKYVVIVIRLSLVLICIFIMNIII